MIPYSLLCANTMNTEVIEPTLVTLVGTRVLYYFVRFIIRNLSIKCSIFRLYFFAVVLLSLIKKRSLVGFCLSHSLAI